MDAGRRPTGGSDPARSDGRRACQRAETWLSWEASQDRHSATSAARAPDGPFLQKEGLAIVGFTREALNPEAAAARTPPSGASRRLIRRGSQRGSLWTTPPSSPASG